MLTFRYNLQSTEAFHILTWKQETMKPSVRNSAIILLLIAILSVLTGCSKQELTIVHVSDIHYFSPALIENQDFMWIVTSKSDGKDTVQSSLIAQAFVDDMLKLKPNAVVITGDLTLNGEVQSHEELRQLMRKLKDIGIEVYVMTGNHDVNMTAYRYTSDGVEEVPSFGSQQFEDHWWDFGYGKALSQDKWSNSYIAALSEKTWLLMVDSNTGSKGTVRKSTLDWIEENLEKAQEEGIRVISATHQNLFVHNENFVWGYRLDNAAALIELYEKYGVELNLSGHLHVQSIVESNGITDIAVSALVDTPLQYGILTISGDKLSYKTKEISNEALKAKAKEVFDLCTKNKVLEELSDVSDQVDKQKMLDVAVQLNREYFLGKFSKVDETALALWKQSDSFFGKYLISVYEEAGTKKDNRKWKN